MLWCSIEFAVGGPQDLTMIQQPQEADQALVSSFGEWEVPNQKSSIVCGKLCQCQKRLGLVVTHSMVNWAATGWRGAGSESSFIASIHGNGFVMITLNLVHRSIWDPSGARKPLSDTCSWFLGLKTLALFISLLFCKCVSSSFSFGLASRRKVRLPFQTWSPASSPVLISTL